MTGLEPFGAAKATASALSEVIKASGDTAAGAEFGKAALTVARFVNVLLLPIAAVSYAYVKARDYFEKDFEREIAEKLKDVPEDSVVAPKASIAGPALQGLAFAHDEPDLKEMYLNLLAAAMDGRVSDDAHPAFVEIIRQLTAEEARLLSVVLTREDSLALAEIRLTMPAPGGYVTLLRNVSNAWDDSSNGPTDNPRIPAYIDNWIRLGLVMVEYDKWIVGDDAYLWTESSPDFVRLKAQREDDQNKVTIQRGIIRRTAFGYQFAMVVGIVDRPEPPAD